MFWQRLNEIGLVILMKHFQDFKVVNVFSVLRYYISFEEGVILHLTDLNLLTPESFVPSLVEFGRRLWRRNRKCKKSLQTDTQTNRRQTTYD